MRNTLDFMTRSVAVNHLKNVIKAINDGQRPYFTDYPDVSKWFDETHGMTITKGNLKSIGKDAAEMLIALKKFPEGTTFHQMAVRTKRPKRERSAKNKGKANELAYLRLLVDHLYASLGEPKPEDPSFAEDPS